MMKLRITAIVLCAAVLIAALAGCSDAPAWYNEGDTPADEYEHGDHTHPGSDPYPEDNPNYFLFTDIDFDAAFHAFAPDTVMIIAGDFTVTWEEMFFNIRGALSYLSSMYGIIPELSDYLMTGSTYAETLLDYAIENSLMYRGLEYGANLNGITFSEEDLVRLDADFESMIVMYGGADDFQNNLWEYDGIKNVALFRYLFTISYLSNVVFDGLYGEDGALVPDDDMAASIADEGFLMAKHILRFKTDEDDDTPLREIEEVQEQLNAYDGDDFDAFFDELMFEFSEDTGIEDFPDGYLFQYGDLVQEFYDASVALEIYGLSDIIETVYGYHIVYRIPINYDVIPSSFLSAGDYRTLRSVVAMDLFDQAIYEWVGNLNPIFTPAFDSIDIVALFSKAS